MFDIIQAWTRASKANAIFFCKAPLIYSWSAGNTAGETKKKVTNGIMIIGQCAGNVRNHPHARENVLEANPLI